MRSFLTCVVVALVGVAAFPACSQSSPRATQTPYQTGDLPGDPSREVILYGNFFPPGAGNPFHTHHGDQWVVVEEGELLYIVKGEEPKLLKKGDSVFTPRGTRHRALNASDKPARTTELQISDKGKPRIVMAP